MMSNRVSLSPQSRQNINLNDGLKSLKKEEEKGIEHYKKSGITQRNFDAPQYQRKPSPVTERRSELFRR
jgi:hypothetical protein